MIVDGIGREGRSNNHSHFWLQAEQITDSFRKARYTQVVIEEKAFVTLVHFMYPKHTRIVRQAGIELWRLRQNDHEFKILAYTMITSERRREIGIGNDIKTTTQR